MLQAIGLSLLLLTAQPRAAVVDPGALSEQHIEQAELRNRISETYRRLYLATPPGERSALLTEMLGDEFGFVRALGTDLALREVSAGTRLHPAVTAACRQLLQDPSPSIRARAAGLLGRLTPEGLHDAIAEALAHESDAHAAAAMLRVIAYQPTPTDVPTILRWLAAGEPALESASQAAAAAHAAGLIDADQTADLLAALRARPPLMLPPQALRLLVRLGSSADHDRVVALLDAADPAVRARAAQALAVVPDALAHLLDAAQQDPGLLPIVIEAGSTLGVTPTQLLNLTRLETPPGFDRIGALLPVALTLDPTARVRSAIQLDPADPLRESLLLSVNGDRTQTPPAIAAALLLAEQRIARDDPEPALAALARLPERIDPFARIRAARVAVIANLMLGRIDRASEAADPPIAALWVESLERAHALPWAADIAHHIAANMNEHMSETLRDRFSLIRSRIARAEPEQTKPAPD